MGGPTVPANWKDPVKIAAKKAEWAESALENSVEYPLARVVDTWVLLNDKGAKVASGLGPLGLIGVIDEHADSITRIFGLDSRMVLKSASIEALANQLRVPVWCWNFQVLDNVNTRVYDPVDMLLSGFREKLSEKLVLQRLGLGLVSSTNPAPEQAEFVYKLVTRLGL